MEPVLLNKELHTLGLLFLMVMCLPNGSTSAMVTSSPVVWKVARALRVVVDTQSGVPLDSEQVKQVLKR